MNAAPYRADQVGSLLRPAWFVQARRLCRSGEMHPGDLVHIEDRAVLDLIRHQEEIGLYSVVDGEFRRDWWDLDFLAQLDGVQLLGPGGEPVQASTPSERPPMPFVAGKIACSRPIMNMDFGFLDTMSKVPAKMTLPAPSMLHFHGGRAAISAEVYPDLDVFWADVAAAYRVAIEHLAAMGCRYLQFDDISVAYLCDPVFQARCRARGDDPTALAVTYARAIDAALIGKPHDMRVALHTCRGNLRGGWEAQGGYAPVVEAMFSTAVDGYFLEFDTERAGGFEPLRALPAGKRAVLGLVSTKLGELESKDFLKRRIDEAARHAPLEQLCLSPQCGFASSHHGNPITEDEQWRKLERVVEVAAEVWGE